MLGRRVPVALLSAAAAVLASAAGASATSVNPIVVNDSQLKPTTATVGGASPLSTTETVQHWFGQTLDPNNGVTYGYSMVGADPNTGQVIGGSSTGGSGSTDVTALPVSVDSADNRRQMLLAILTIVVLLGLAHGPPLLAYRVRSREGSG